MASFGAPVLPPMPDFSSSHSSFPTAGDMKLHLQNILHKKVEQLQLAGNLGQRVLHQQSELEERIKQIEALEVDKDEDDELDEEARQRYQELADTIVAWDEENVQLSTCFGNNAKDLLNVGLQSPAMQYTELSRDEPERTKSATGTSVAQSRRAKNAAHRADDVEFAFEIGSGLLTEVRRLQSLLGERDKAIQDMKEEKDDLEKSVEGLRTALKQQEQSSDKFKEENWNLEVRQQELMNRNEDLTASIQRLESDHKRLTKNLAQSRDAVDQHKNEAERLNNIIEEIKAKHDTDIAQARKHAASLARDKSDLQQALDTVKAEAARAARRLPRYGSPLTPGGPETKDFLTPAGHDDPDDVFGTTGRGSTNRRNLDVSSLFPPDEFGMDLNESPDPSPLRRPFLAANHPTNEIEALQQRLAHAQRQINTLKGSLNREKQLRMRLEGAEAQGQDFDEDQTEGFMDENTAVLENKKAAKRATPFKVGGRSTRGRGRGRGRGGITLIQRLGMAAGSPSSDYNDDEYHLSDDSPPPPVPSIPINFNNPDDEEEQSQFFSNSREIIQEDDQEEVLDQRSRSPSPTPAAPEVNSNRTSVDGMDPAFANVLRRTPSNGSYTSSPLRQAVLGRSARGGAVGRRKRGGVPFKEARPPSIVDAPEVLAAELGGFEESPLKPFNTSLLNDTEVIEEDDDDSEYIRVKRVEKVEFGCQTEFVEDEKTVVLIAPPVIAPVEPEPTPIPTPPPVVHVEVGIQSDAEPEPVAPPPIIAPPPAVRAEMGIQSEPEPEPVLPPKPVMVEMSLQTDPEPAAVIETAELGVQYDAPEPPRPLPPVLAESSVGTDPLPQPAPVQVPAVLGKSLPPLVTSDTGRRATITQADVSRTNSSAGDTTITRTFLGAPVVDEDEVDEGEETETGAETEDDYHDARQSIVMTTPSEDFHSVRTMTDNDYSDSEDDAESIKASHFSSKHRRSAASLNRPPTSASSYFAPVPARSVSYETVGVSADLYELPEPVVIHAQKPEVKEMSIQTDEWKPPAPPVPVISSIIPSPSPKPGLYRVGSTSSHQFQFVPPPFGTSVPAPVFTAPSPVNTPLSSVFRESSSGGGSIGRRPATADRQSIESLFSSAAADDASTRSRVPSTSTNGPILASMDKTRPPVMSLPPPPKLPPPPNSMPPPNFIPDRRMAANGVRDGPPPRPSSPPPADLIQRATTPLGSILAVPGANPHSVRSLSASMPPSQAGLRQPPSTSSFRSAAHAPGHMYVPSGTLSSHSVRERQRSARSTTSLTSDHSGIASPRSSISSDRHQTHYDERSTPAAGAPSTPNKSADMTPRANNVMSTDPTIIHAITQTMIGEFLYKYTRRAIGKGVGEKRHKRFFWVHPYTKTLYWSSADPGSSNVSESSAKSAYIEGVRSVLDPNPMPPGLYQYSVVVSTPQREMKITALTKERHDIWLNALKYLLSRPNNPNVVSPGNNNILPQTPDNTDHSRRPPLATSPQSQRSARSPVAGEPWNTTPRGQRSRSQLSVGRSGSKRSGTPALEYLRWNAPESPYSPDRSFVDVPAPDADDLDFELHGENASDDGFEGLENVRACCDGRHTVGGHHHHHHHHLTTQDTQTNQGTLTSRRSIDNRHLDPVAAEHVRPASPAWSFRSRTGSAQSHEGGTGGGIFSWGRREDGKSRFGSRRSTKTSVPALE